MEPLNLALKTESKRKWLHLTGEKNKSNLKAQDVVGKDEELCTSGLSHAIISPQLTWLQMQYVGSFGSTGNSKSMLGCCWCCSDGIIGLPLHQREVLTRRVEYLTISKKFAYFLRPPLVFSVALEDLVFPSLLKALAAPLAASSLSVDKYECSISNSHSRWSKSFSRRAIPKTKL